MKYARFTILLGVLVSTLVAGYVLAATQPPTDVLPAPTKPLVVPTEEPQAQWKKVLPKTNVGEKWRMAAFLDEKFGITGRAGDVGKARYTSDGGKTWKEESLPAESGTPYISRDGKFLTVNQWGKGLTLLKYE